ncbi:MAG: RNA 2',3'-cyclic phosphodiesterase [Caulobacterales bacterium]|jgi:2'-5' RNA ligase
MIRLFAALPIPQDIGLALARRQTGVEGARWRPPETLHITLRFFGDIREDLARDLDAELMTLRGPAFGIELSGVGAFGEAPDLHVLWAGVGESEPLRRLAKACETAARRAGLKPETRHYRPHLTLAYLRHPDPAEVAAWIQANNLLKSPPLRVERFGLYSSFLGSEQAHYRLEAEYPLLTRPPHGP